MNCLWILFVIATAQTSYSGGFKLGIENISPQEAQLLKEHRVALIMNQTSKDTQGQRTVDILRQNNIIVARLLAPEHGIDGTRPAEHAVYDAIDSKTNIPITSLYGAGTGKKITAQTLKDVDLIAFDIQDSGMRHYTYVSTLYKAMEAAAQHTKKFVVFDRPNPLGWQMEGPLVHSSIVDSFIAIAPIPVRHGLTVGELAHYFNKYHFNNAVPLHVVSMSEYSRTSLPQTVCSHPLSPNIKSKESILGYSFLGLLGEIQPFDVAVGTDKAFQCIMLPEAKGLSAQQWKEVTELLARFHVKSSPYSYYSERKHEKYKGVHIQIADINKLPSFSLLLGLLAYFKKNGVNFVYSKFFDNAVGTPFLRAFIDGTHAPHEFNQSINIGLEAFYEKIKGLCLYQPFPHKVIL